MWKNLSTAIDLAVFYDYTYIDTPWFVSPSTANLTFEGEGVRLTNGKTLVGSAEQGFLSMHLGYLVPYVSCGPCFRDEPVIDAFHQPHFMKAELFTCGSKYKHEGYLRAAGERHMEKAQKIMRHISGKNIVKVVTEEGYDLEINGIEVGSYGVRHKDDLMWAYGTLIAEPRFSLAVNLNDQP